MRIVYDPKFLSEEEIAEINDDKSDIELIEHDLNLKVAKNDLILSTILFILSAIPGGVASSFVYDMIKLAIKNFKKKHVF